MHCGNNYNALTDKSGVDLTSALHSAEVSTH